MCGLLIKFLFVILSATREESKIFTIYEAKERFLPCGYGSQSVAKLPGMNGLFKPNDKDVSCSLSTRSVLFEQDDRILSSILIIQPHKNVCHVKQGDEDFI